MINLGIALNIILQVMADTFKRKKKKKEKEKELAAFSKWSIMTKAA